MKRAIIGVIGLVLPGITAAPAVGQVHVVVGVNAPPVSAHVVIGEPAYLVTERVYVYPYRPYGIWVTDRHLVRLHRRHVLWIEHEHARIARLRHRDRAYWKAVRDFERERVKRERAIDREYRNRTRELNRDSRERERDRGGRARGRRRN